MANDTRTSFSPSDGAGHPVFSSDGCVHVVRTEWGTSLDNSTISSNDKIINDYTSLNIIAPTATEEEITLAGGYSILSIFRGQPNSKLNSYNGPMYYIVNGNLYHFQWCMYPKISYNAESDRFVLLCYANLIAGTDILQLADSPLYGTFSTSGTNYKEEVRSEVEKPSTSGGATAYKPTCPIKGLDTDGDIELKDTIDAADETETVKPVTVALLYSLGQFVSYSESSGESGMLPIFTPPVIIDVIHTDKAMVDFHYSPRPTNAGGGGGGGGETTAQQCRIPYYVA